MSAVSKDFLQNLVSELDDHKTIGFLLTGSHARGDPTIYSDVDLIKFVTKMPLDESEKYFLRYRENRLISISVSTVGAKIKETKKPETAVWTIPGLRQSEVLLDKNGSLAKLKRIAVDFSWQPLQKTADEFASYNLMGNAEEAHKVLGALDRKDESSVLYGTIGLLLNLTKIIIVQRGVLIESENSFFRQAQEIIGKDSAWSLQHKIACGFGQISSIETRAVAILRLYAETAKILESVIKPTHAGVIQRAIGAIQDFLFKH